ncbi:phosphonate C-P lyase system protein PhnH [Campylobacterota bacterium DY0563]
MDKIDIEKLNRENFRSMMNALSRPGNIEDIKPLFKSNLLAVANTLLYAEVSYFYKGNEDFELINAITNSKEFKEDEADYVFCDTLDERLFEVGKVGTMKDPEFSSTYIFKCKDFDGIEVKLSGPGINGSSNHTLPISKEFIEKFNNKNSTFPMGNEVFFINEKAQVLALSRTTKVEVL